MADSLALFWLPPSDCDPKFQPEHCDPCSLCGSHCAYDDYAVAVAQSEGRRRVCLACALQKAPELLALVALAQAGETFARRRLPQPFLNSIKSLEDAPDRLRRVLENALNGPGGYANSEQYSRLATLIANEIRQGLGSKDVEQMKAAVELCEEGRNRIEKIPDDLPF